MDYRRSNENLFIRLDPGEELHESLREVARVEGIGAAAVTSGIGRVENALIGHLDAHGIYQQKMLIGPVELLSMQGNIASLKGEPFTHLHVVVSDDEHIVHGGHLFEARVTVTAEIHLRVLGGRVTDLFMSRCEIIGSDFVELKFDD
jgi:predicted DNA-binding protein with PD1-like motif